MDELIVEFLNATSADEYINQAYQSFKILNDLDYQDVYSDFIDILTNESFVTTDSLKDEFNVTLHRKLDEVLRSHRVGLSQEATLYQKNQMLIALFTIQQLEDYTSVMCVLESLETDEVKLTSILEDYCELDYTEMMTIIEDFNPIALMALKQYVENQTALNDLVANENIKQYIPVLKAFFKLYGTNNIGHLLIENDVKPGQSLETYLTYVDNLVASTVEQTALNVISVLYMTPDSLKSPLELYRKHSLEILHDLALVSKVEPMIISMTDRVNEYLKVQRVEQ